MVTQCKPPTKDHLVLKTAFAGTKGWSVVTGFTVIPKKTLAIRDLAYVKSCCVKHFAGA